MVILTADEIRQAEDRAAQAGLTYEEMMETAGSLCAERILQNSPEAENIVILCGCGKNGGDGYVAARYLKNANINVSIILAFDKPGDRLSEKNRAKLPNGIEIILFSDSSEVKRALDGADIVIDAVFGIGFRGDIPEHIKALFASAAATKAKKIAIDIPSGLSVGIPDPSGCFKADETLSMLCFKREHVYKPWSDFCGKVSIIPIGFDAKAGRAFTQALQHSDIKNMIVPRPVISNKGTFGKALIVGGCRKMPGAAVISARGALSTGVGLVKLAFPDSCYPAIAPQLCECVLEPLSSDKNGEFSSAAAPFILSAAADSSAVAAGCGMGTGEGAKEILYSLIENYDGTLIIDADGINILARNINVLKEPRTNIILTPHPGEMSRLTGRTISEINSDRENIAAPFAEEYNVVLLLKGANTVVACPDGRCFINPTGSSALSRGGSGDLLTGIIVSFAAQGMSAPDAAAVGAYVHGLAGETAGKKYTSYAASADRIISSIPEALSQILSGK